MKDLTLYCIQCDEPFFYVVKEQMRHERHGFDPPRRCQTCRQHKVRLDDTEADRKFRRKPKSFRRNNHLKEMSSY